MKSHDERQAVSSNLFPPILGLLGIGVLAFVGWLLGMTGQTYELSHCNSLTNDQSRLTCYDKLAAPRQPAKGAFVLPQTTHERPQ